MNDYSLIPKTVKEALTKWDAGENIFSVEMGGLGPGYEQCIQILAFELMREFLNDNIEDVCDTEDDWKKKGKPRRDAVTHKLDKQYGFSGAQVGAATNLAFCVLRKGYRSALEEDVVKERLIQVSHEMPKAYEKCQVKELK